MPSEYGPRKRPIDFKSYAARRAWLRYGHSMTPSGKPKKRGQKSIFQASPGHTQTFVRGKLVKTRHQR